MGFLPPKVNASGTSDPIVSRLAAADTVPWWKKPNLRMLYLLMFPTCMGIEFTSGFDSQMINALQIVPSWKEYFNYPTGSIKGIISASYSLGAILSLPLVPIVNERLGRRKAILIGSAVQCAGAIVQCFSVNTAMYIIARIILGFGIPTCIVAASSLIGELGYPKERPVLTSLFNVTWGVGSILAAGICFATNSITSDWTWRLPSILQICPSAVQVALILFMPESPRWLVSKDRTEEAYEILVKYHAEGDHGSEFVAAEMAQISSTLTMEMEASKQTWGDLFRTSGMRKCVLIVAMLGLFTQWSGNTLISYYLSDILDLIGHTESVFKNKINLVISSWGLVCGLTAALLVTRFKRRIMFLTCTCSLLCCYVAWTICMQQAQKIVAAGVTGYTSARAATIAFIFIYNVCYVIGYNALTYTYLVELLPYAERSRGIAFFQFFGRGAGFFSTFVNPIGMDSIGCKYLISYCCFLAFEIGFVYFMFPETFGRTLEELAFMFEDKEKSEKAVRAVENVVGEGAVRTASVVPEKGGAVAHREQVEDASVHVPTKNAIA